jgi:hypothetical protein
LERPAEGDHNTASEGRASARRGSLSGRFAANAARD